MGPLFHYPLQKLITIKAQVNEIKEGLQHFHETEIFYQIPFDSCLSIYGHRQHYPVFGNEYNI